MITNYRSLHRNHAHQLIITVSKHYYSTQDGILKYQAKPIEISLEKLNESKKINVIFLSVRDHCTGMFYAEIALGAELPDVLAFLNRAWSKKAEYPFCGVPKLLSFPKKLESLFPYLEDSIELLGIKRFNVTSGFQGGIRDIKTIESRLFLSDGKEINIASNDVYKICSHHAHEVGRNEKYTKAQMWELSDYPIIFPPNDWSNCVR